MGRMFPGSFGMEHSCSRRGGDSGLWVIPERRLRPPSKTSPTKLVSGVGRNIPGNVRAELLFLPQGAESPALRGGVSAPPTFQPWPNVQTRAGSSPEVLGRNNLFWSLWRNLRPEWRSLRPVGTFPENLGQKFRVEQVCNGTISGAAI